MDKQNIQHPIDTESCTKRTFCLICRTGSRESVQQCRRWSRSQTRTVLGSITIITIKLTQTWQTGWAAASTHLNASSCARVFKNLTVPSTQSDAISKSSSGNALAFRAAAKRKDPSIGSSADHAEQTWATKIDLLKSAQGGQLRARTVQLPQRDNWNLQLPRSHVRRRPCRLTRWQRHTRFTWTIYRGQKNRTPQSPQSARASRAQRSKHQRT